MQFFVHRGGLLSCSGSDSDSNSDSDSDSDSYSDSGTAYLFQCGPPVLRSSIYFDLVY